jgi:hypothetical protein
VSKKSLLETHRELWKPNQISNEELTRCYSNRSATAQSVLAIFGAHPDHARSVLGNIPESDLTAEQCLLLALAHDEFGLHDNALRDRYEKQLLKESPGSIFAKVLLCEKIRRRVVSRQAASPMPAGIMDPESSRKYAEELLHDYDSDGDGILDQLELALLFRLEPQRLRVGPLNPSPWYHAQNFLGSVQSIARARKLDPRRLDIELLSAWLQVGGAPAFPRGGPAFPPRGGGSIGPLNLPGSNRPGSSSATSNE